MVREELGIEHYAGDVDTHTVDCEEEIEPIVSLVNQGKGEMMEWSGH